MRTQRRENTIIKNRLVGFVVLLSILTCPGNSQEFSFQMNGNDYAYTIPADTLPRNIHIEGYFDDSQIHPNQIDTLWFTFNPENMDTVEYRFGPFMYSPEYYLHPTNSFIVDVIPYSSIDSVYFGAVMIDSQMVEGIRYVDVPGDSLSGFQIVLSGEDPLDQMSYIQIGYVTQQCSDWRKFQPLAMGNIWNYSIPSESSSAERLEVIDVEESNGMQTYTVARERVEGYEYTLLPPDTFAVITYDSDLYRIHWDGVGGSFILINDFRPLSGEAQNDGIEGVMPLDDGSVNYLMTSTAGTDLWTWGIGQTSGAWDGGGSLSLVGYRLDGVVWGNIGHLVNIVEEPSLPERFSFKLYPNPFNNSFNLEFQVPISGMASIEIYNLKGVMIWSDHIYADADMDVRKRINMNDLTGAVTSSGIYFVRVNAGDFVESKKILLAK